MFYLVRHGQTDYSMKNSGIYQGFGVNLAPLSERGVRQIQETAKDVRLSGTEIILSSPLYQGFADSSHPFQRTRRSDYCRDRSARMAGR